MFIRSERNDFLNRLFIDFRLWSMRGRAICNQSFAYFYIFIKFLVPKIPPAAPNSPDRSCLSTELLGQSLRAQVKLRGVGVALLSTCPSHSREGQSRINVV